jgi:creatinine amidohydrolase
VGADPAVRLLADLNREAARALAGEALLLLPLGATEQHGPHLPVGTDTLLVQAVAERAAAAARIPVVLAPPLALGSSDHHLVFGGTLSLTTDTYYRVLMDLGRSAAASGFRRIFLLNGHGGNHELMQLAVRDLAREAGIAAAAGSWWAMAHEELVQVGAGITNVPGHAGAFETAAVLAVAAHLVAVPPARPDWSGRRPAAAAARVELPGSWSGIDGFSDSPADASAVVGAAFLEVAVARVAAELASFQRAATESLARLDAAGSRPGRIG